MNLYEEIIDFLDEEKEKHSYVSIAPDLYSDFCRKITDLEKQHALQGKKPKKSAQEYTPSSTGTFKEKSTRPNIPSEYSSLDIKSLQDIVLTCNKCNLYNSRKNVVFGEGNFNAELMFIGEGPGRDEDLQGRPFVGKSGQLLTKMIKAMGYERTEVYIANIVKCRPPFNRNPNPDEAKCCLGYLNRQIELIKPKVLVLLGAVPLRFLLEKSGIKRLHGYWHEYMGVKTMPTFHPAFLLRDPTQKKYAWDDLQKVMKFVGKL